MPNVISSAIVNAPPAEMMGDILNKRNKTHRLGPETNENMIPMFSDEPDGKLRNNKRLLPRRNWCSIREFELGTSPPPTPPESDDESDASSDHKDNHRRFKPQRTLSLNRNDLKPRQLIRRLSGRAPKSYLASIDYATPSPPMTPKDNQQFSRRMQMQRSFTSPQSQDHDEASTDGPPTRPTFFRRPTDLKDKDVSDHGLDNTQGHINLQHGLDICLHAEIDQKDPSGATHGYRLLVPALFYDGDGDENVLSYRRPNLLQRLSSYRARGVGKFVGPHDGDSVNHHGHSTSETSSADIDDRPLGRHRRWSFGLDKRREYQSQSPPRAEQRAMVEGKGRDPVAEARALGVFGERPQDVRNADSSPPSASEEPSEPPITMRRQHRSVNGPPQNRNQAMHHDGHDSEDDDSVIHNRLDSLDYHANLVNPNSKDYDGLPTRRLSKVEKMLGIESSQPQYQSKRTSSVQYESYPTAEGYDGIDAYPGSDEKKGWRRSLSFFTKNI